MLTLLQRQTAISSVSFAEANQRPSSNGKGEPHLTFVHNPCKPLLTTFKLPASFR